MSKWTFKIDTSSYFHNDNVSIVIKGKKLARQLDNLVKNVEKSRFLTKDERDYFSNQLEELSFSFDDIDSVEEFDYHLEILYDLGDTVLEKQDMPMTRKFLWINTR